ncbi:DNA replication/repair protein RecF [Porcipelethomonas sp.]|uniref:DNA replication/repair protein RecF n=1 Tax=Porcipelethomonas sp. TaxID=2981675 RepID=UPI003EF428AD
MYVTAVKADGYKNLKNVMITPHPEYNLITGMNAQGKTNLLEAIWLMTGCRSFRGSKDRDYICLDKNIMELGMSFYDGRRTQKIEYAMSRENIKDKKIKLNGVPIKGTNGLFDSFKAVVFTPDDTELIKGGPEKRRSFVDLCCCQLNGRCLDSVRRYDLLLNHRNVLLKSIAAGKASRDSVYVWDQQLAAIGTFVSGKRHEYIKKLNKACSELYSRITGGREELTVSYNSNIFGGNPPEENEGNDAVAKYYMKLSDSVEDDIRLGYTLWGAHRDDLIVKINGLNIREFGSQGQKKTAALVMKLGQAEIYSKNNDETPVILLDDVMGELDESRQALVFDIVKNMQVFITACNENAVKGLSQGAVFRVEKGEVTQY